MKTIWNFLTSKFFWINILIAVCVALLILFGTLLWTKYYTNHGESIVVPDLTHKYVEEAELDLEELGLSYEVIDSVHLRSFNPGEIAEQSPAAGTHVKANRKIYITINCRQKQMIRVPDLVGESFRKAQSNLRALGFNADSVRYKPYEFSGEVLDILYQGRSLQKGEKVEDGSMLVLVVGREDTENVVYVPNLIGMSYDDAMNAINTNELSVGNISYDVRPFSDTERQQYHVIKQTPAPGTQVFRGKLIELRLSRSANAASEEFF